MKRVFVVVPSIRPTSPIKGAAALCNGLAEYLPVTIVPLKTQENAGLCLNPQVKILSLSAYKTWKEKSRVFKDRLKEAGGRDGAVSISLCFSADLFNFFMARQAVILSSVRGNLTRNYSFDYGKLGVLTAVFHYIVLRRFAKVIAMSDAMENELWRFGIRRTVVIGNFIDEAAMESRRVYNHDQTGAVKFVFLGRLSTIKRPDLLLEGLENAKKQGVNCHLDLIGDGPLRNELGNKARTLGLDKNVLFHGHLTDPYSLLQSADYLILPSESEGVSRAVLEALFSACHAFCEMWMQTVN